MDLLIATNPDPESSLPLLLLVPLGDGLVFRTKGTWPRTAALYCHPAPRSEWPAEPDIVERVPLTSCQRFGASIDVVAKRRRESRSQIVYTRARGREMVFWQSAKTRKQARPDVRIPTARASGLTDLTILVEAHERYPYRFANQQVTTARRPLSCGDYAVELDGRVVASVERKSLTDLVSSLTSGRLRFAAAELATLPRAAVVIEDRYSQVFTQPHVRPALVADGLAELQVRYPSVPLVFCETRPLAEEWTYRYLAAALEWIGADEAAADRVGAGGPSTRGFPCPTEVGCAQRSSRPGACPASRPAGRKEHGVPTSTRPHAARGGAAGRPAGSLPRAPTAERRPAGRARKHHQGDAPQGRER